MSKPAKRREILFEFTRLQNNLRVCAVDAASGLEVVTLVPVTTSQRDAKTIALKKLLWRLEQEEGPGHSEPVRHAHIKGKLL